MKHILFLVLLCASVCAEPVTFTYLSGTINSQFIFGNGEWQIVDGIRVKILPNGMPDEPNNATGIFWAAAVDNYTVRKDFSVSIRGNFCVQNTCQIATMTGTLTSTPQGLAWTVPPSPLQLGDINLWTITNIPNNIYGSTRDLAIGGALVSASVPEPASLFLLGTGLAAIASRLKRKRK